MHNDIILIRVTDILEKQFPTTNIEITDYNKQVSVKGKNKHTTSKINSFINEKEDLFTKEMRKLSVPVFDINTSTDVHTQLKNHILRWH